MLTTIYFRDSAEAEFFAMRVGGDVTHGEWLTAVTFSTDAF